MSDQTCATCKAGDIDDETQVGKCHRYAPQVNGITCVVWPEVHASNWCLEWKPKARTFSVPRQGKHAIPDDWKPSEDCVLLAKSLGINAYSEAAKMRDHARYTKRMVADWDAAFRNWLRKGQR